MLRTPYQQHRFSETQSLHMLLITVLQVESCFKLKVILAYLFHSLYCLHFQNRELSLQEAMEENVRA